MPPEQACADLENVGPASDIYALGAILFEMLTGVPPFRADTITRLVRKIMTEPAPAPSRIRRGVPAALDAICAKALAKDPAERFASMEEFAAALTRSVTLPQRRRRIGVAIAMAACSLSVVAGVVFYVKTDNGTIEIRLNDPNANVAVTVDGNEVRLTEDGRVTKLRAGLHELEVKGPGFEAQSRIFKVIRGNNPAVEVELKPRAGLAAETLPKGDSVSAARNDQRRLAELLAQGRKLDEAARYQELAAVVEDALKIDPESPSALAMRATVRGLLRNDRAGAMADAELALRLNPETVEALVVRAGLNGRLGKSDEVIADLTIALRLDPRHPSAWWMRGQAYLNKKEYHQTLADTTEAIKLGQPLPEPFSVRAGAYAYLGEFDKALGDLNKAIEILAHPQCYVQRSATYLKLGKADKAAADWETAKKLVPNLPDTARVIIPTPPKPIERKKLTAEEGQAFTRAMKTGETAWSCGQLDASRKAFEEACRVDPTSGVARASLARVLQRQGQSKAAVQDADEALRLEPDLALAYMTRGSARFALKDPAGCIADLSISLRLDPSQSAAWNDRGWAYMTRRNYHQALADLIKAVDLPGDPSSFTNLGHCYLCLGDNVKALAQYERAARAQPKNARWRLICSVIKARLGDSAGSRQDRAAALRIDPGMVEDICLPTPIAPVKQDP
jgi:tetratricopeptide (TPR) repeat protein